MVYRFKWPFPKEHRTLQTWWLSSRFTMVGVMSFAKVIGAFMNKIHVHNEQRLLDAVSKRQQNQPLITVLNHSSVLDDPVLHALFPWKLLVQNNFQFPRWCVVAQDICCTRALHTWFFARGRCVPVIRGDGVYQKAIDFCIEKLNQGEWVHIFPEGAVNVENIQMRLKWGVGRMVAECERDPLVLPMWHIGMDDVRPNKPPYNSIQKGKHVTVLIGDYINCKDLVHEMRQAKCSPREMRKAVTDRIQDQLYSLRSQAEDLHEKLLNSMQNSDTNACQ